MRISNDESDAGYAAWVQLHIDQGGPPAVNIFLDDVEQKNCSMADDSQGVIRRCKLDGDGNIFAIGDEIAMEEVSGTVRIELPPRPAL